MAKLTATWCLTFFGPALHDQMITFLHAVVKARIGTLSPVTERIIRTCQLVHHVRLLLVLELCHLTRVKLRIPF